MHCAVPILCMFESGVEDLHIRLLLELRLKHCFLNLIKQYRGMRNSSRRNGCSRIKILQAKWKNSTTSYCPVFLINIKLKHRAKVYTIKFFRIKDKFCKSLWSAWGNETIETLKSITEFPSNSKSQYVQHRYNDCSVLYISLVQWRGKGKEGSYTGLEHMEQMKGT